MDRRTAGHDASASAHRRSLVGLLVDLAALIVVVLVVGWVNESGSDAANQLTLVCLVGGCAALGFLWGRLWWIPAVVVGATVAAQHVFSVATGMPEPDVHLPPEWWGTASLLILLIPTLIAAYIGARVRRSVDTARAGPRDGSG